MTQHRNTTTTNTNQTTNEHTNAPPPTSEERTQTTLQLPRATTTTSATTTSLPNLEERRRSSRKRKEHQSINYTEPQPELSRYKRLPPEERERLKQYNTTRARERRQNLSPQARIQDRNKQRLYRRIQRARMYETDTPEEAAKRKEKDAQRKRHSRQKR